MAALIKSSETGEPCVEVSGGLGPQIGAIVWSICHLR